MNLEIIYHPVFGSESILGCCRLMKIPFSFENQKKSKVAIMCFPLVKLVEHPMVDRSLPHIRSRRSRIDSTHLQKFVMGFVSFACDFFWPPLPLGQGRTKLKSITSDNFPPDRQTVTGSEMVQECQSDLRWLGWLHHQLLMFCTFSSDKVHKQNLKAKNKSV